MRHSKTLNIKKGMFSKPQPTEKSFFWKDKTGHGFTNTWSLNWMRTAMKGERSYDGQAASTWAKDAEVGERWENAAHEITRIK